MSEEKKISRRVWDLHCDTVTDGLGSGYGLGHNQAHVDLFRPPEGMGWCQTFAIFMPDALRGAPAWDFFEESCRFFQEELTKFPHRVGQARSAGEVERLLEAGKIAALLSVEGGSALLGEPDRAWELARRGVQYLTLTWNGPNELGCGCGGTGGLTDVGFAALEALEAAGIVADVSHLSDAGFWDVVGRAKKPFIATHSNSRTVCPHPRNLTDDQFRVLVECRGLVGLNFCTEFISPSGKFPPEEHRAHRRQAPAGMVTREELMAHVFHFLELGGEDTLALGSDFDGSTVPDFLPGAASFPALERMFLDAGLGEALTHKILFQNAFDFLQRRDQGGER